MSTGISRYLKYWTSHKFIPANTNSLSMTSIYSMEYMSTQTHHMPTKPQNQSGLNYFSK